MNFHIVFCSGIVRSKFSWILYFYMRNNYFFVNKRIKWNGFGFSTKNFLTITSNSNEADVNFLHFFFLFRFSFPGSDDKQNSRGEEETILFSLPVSFANYDSEIYLELRIWDKYFLFLMARHFITRLFLHKTYTHLGINI